MNPSTGPADATAGQDCRTGPPSPGDKAYKAPPVQATGGRCFDAVASDANASPLDRPAEKRGARRVFAMTANTREIRNIAAAGAQASASGSDIRADLVRAGLMPEGHTVAGPGGVQLPANTSLQNKRRLERLDPSRRDALGDGWRVVSIKGGDEEGGVTSHRGVLHPDEHVDPSVLLTLVENELGFTLEQVRSVYRQGPMSDAQRELRGRIDARLLAVSWAGGNLLELAKVFGWKIKASSAAGGESCDTMERAIARAREAS